MASGRRVGQRPDCHTFLCKFWHFQIAVSCLRLGLFTPNLGILWILVCSLWLCESIVANPIIYRLVPRPSRFEIRQWPAMSESNTYTNLFSKAWIHHLIMEKCQSQQISAKTLPITIESQPSTGPIPTSLHAIRNNSLLVGIFSLADSRKMPNHNFFIYILLRYIRQIWSSQCLYIGQT